MLPEAQFTPELLQDRRSIILPTRQYIDLLTSLITHSHSRIIIDTMTLFSGEKVDEIVNQIYIAGDNRGVLSHIKVDPHPLFHRLLNRGPKAGGTSTHIVDQIKYSPFSFVDERERFMKWYEMWQRYIPILGFHHGKSFVIDSIGGIGGVNLNPAYLDAIDYMIVTSNTNIVEALANYHLNRAYFTADTEINCDDQSSLLIDVGIPFSSCIQNGAIDLIYSATDRIHIISQYYPEGKVHKALEARAQQGVEVIVVVPFSRHDFTHTLNRGVARLSRGIFHDKQCSYNLVRIPHNVHARGIVIDQKRAIAGSHNITAPSSSYFGLTEIALDTTDEEIVIGISDFIKESMDL